ncbi:unnamed protein product [Vitrella brassicaformis CCMP3155]|uniref:Uncharacterized protein n=1 Tax=Vitrella brassicaformis (strain CCMP3155) TaxID=1169540 RepID=A0A0G4GRH9_VITBC|nr:unnamed protein product [Vitrella brassicaformis CCMP3155]|eukprot:CEM33169.1 unnamed protein product [Vitrella brassicaformis CCMP3155]
MPSLRKCSPYTMEPALLARLFPLPSRFRLNNLPPAPLLLPVLRTGRPGIFSPAAPGSVVAKVSICDVPTFEDRTMYCWNRSPCNSWPKRANRGARPTCRFMRRIRRRLRTGRGFH